MFLLAIVILTSTCLLGKELVVSSPLQNNNGFSLDIIHFNDFHARFEPTSLQNPVCQTSCIGGFARLYYEIYALLREKPSALVLFAGDSFQGTIWYTLLKWNVTQQFMNLLPIDAHAIGNHEFDDGPQGLAPYLCHLKAPVLAANIDTTDELLLQNLYRRSIIVERNSKRIGIIGLITSTTATISNVGKTKFTDERLAAKQEAASLAAQGVDVVIVLSHCGLDVDEEIAEFYGENIDIIIGGHSHSLLYNGPAPSNESVAGPYPVVVKTHNHTHHKVLIVQASAFTKYLGNFTVHFDHKNKIISWDGVPIYLDASIPEDKSIKAKLKPYTEQMRAAENVRIGATTVPLEYDACVFGECNTGDIICDAMVEKAKKVVSSDYPFIGLIARGNIRAGSDAGNITRGNLYGILPFSDQVYSYPIKCSYIAQALEYSVAESWSTKPFKGPNVLQLSGLRVTFNTTNPVGKRVLSIEVFKEDFIPLNVNETCQLVTISYLASGGDGFNMLKNNEEPFKILGYDESIVEEYITNHSPLSQNRSGRIVILE